MVEHAHVVLVDRVFDSYCKSYCFRPGFVGFCGDPRSRRKREPHSSPSIFLHTRIVSARQRLSLMESL